MTLRPPESERPSRLALPGFGLPLNFIPREAHSTIELLSDGKTYGSVQHDATGEGRSLFQSALNDDYVSLNLTTLREFTMLHLMNQLTDKPDWDQKVFDDAIVAKWRAEALSVEGIDITERMVDHCIAELRYKAEIFREQGAVSVYNGDVVKSDTAVPGALKDALRAAVTPLEDVPARYKDWHPGSDGKVLDLVHPSLFPLVYGRSRILPDSLTTLEDCVMRCGEGVVVPIPSDAELKMRDHFGNSRARSPFSAKYQWLPCEVEISGEGAKITSYINNLHPQQHKELYRIIEQIIDCAIPLWNMSLTPVKTTSYRYKRIPFRAARYTFDCEEYDEDEDGPQQQPGEGDDDFQRRKDDWLRSQVVQPEPEVFQPPTVPRHMVENYLKADGRLKDEKTVDLKRDYGSRGLQVIVKLANIHLTPENPEYGGGTWHVEGQLNEHICASALYYYDSANITESHLAFRQASCTDTTDIGYWTGRHEWLEVVFGCQQGGAAVQEVGAVETREGRLVTFPNILQHRVQPFRLADPTKPGHRKLLALFLVDPNIRVISTANVPCQQREWWSDAIRRGEGAVAGLPAEVLENVVGGVEEFPIGLEEAKEMRVELMEERGEFVVHHLKMYEGHTFSLCEH